MVAQPRKSITAHRLNILILYDQHSIHIPTVLEYLESFSSFSRHNIYFAHATTGGSAANPVKCEFDLSIFDVVVISYSVRLSLTWHLSPSFAEQLRNYTGLKILFIQDEYESTNTAKSWIRDLGVHIVFTCVPDQFLDVVYPRSELPHVEFVQILTGYVPIKAELSNSTKPHPERHYIIGYRGRILPYWYGALGREKFVIGKRMREICEARNIHVNIEWDDSKRIYGNDWYRFLEDCNATLGTESGSNVFDFDGNLSRRIQTALTANPNLTFEEAWETYLKDNEGKVIMNQISPRVFESISYRTALILFEGNYSDVVKPDIHFIPLKKDFSNVDEVLSKVQDFNYIKQITDKAYEDIIKSGKYSYKQFIEGFDDIVGQRITSRSKGIITSTPVCYRRDGEEEVLIPTGSIFSLPINADVLGTTDSPTILLQRFRHWVSIEASLPQRIALAVTPLWLKISSRLREKIKGLLKAILYRVF